MSYLMIWQRKKRSLQFQAWCHEYKEIDNLNSVQSSLCGLPCMIFIFVKNLFRFLKYIIKSSKEV